MEHADDVLVPGLRLADELVGEATRPAGDRDACRGRNRLLPDERLDAAPAAAGAAAAVGRDRDVTELAGEPVGAAEEPPAEDDAAADPDLAEDADEVVDPDRRPRPVLRERGEVRLVLDMHGEPDAPPQLVRNREVAPAEVRCEHDDAGRLLDEPGDRDEETDGS